MYLWTIIYDVTFIIKIIKMKKLINVDDVDRITVLQYKVKQLILME